MRREKWQERTKRWIVWLKTTTNTRVISEQHLTGSYKHHNKHSITLSTAAKLRVINCARIKPQISSCWVHLSTISSAFELKSASALVSHWSGEHFRLRNRHNKSHAVWISTFLFRTSWMFCCAVRHIAWQYCFWEFSTYYIRSKTGYLLIKSSWWKKKSSQFIFRTVWQSKVWKLIQWVYNPNSRSSSSFNSWASFCIFSSCKKEETYIYIIINNF